MTPDPTTLHGALVLFLDGVIFGAGFTVAALIINGFYNLFRRT